MAASTSGDGEVERWGSAGQPVRQVFAAKKPARWFTKAMQSRGRLKGWQVGELGTEEPRRRSGYQTLIQKGLVAAERHLLYGLKFLVCPRVWVNCRGTSSRGTALEESNC